jgi:NitT/TauT family transport system substrate-binding protein
MMWGWTTVAVLLALLSVPSRGTALDRVTVVHSSVSGSQAVLFVARDARIFEKHGLEVDIRFIAGGPPAISALLAGEVQIALMSGPATIAAVLGGADAAVVMAVVNTMDHVMVARKDFRKPADLKGRTLGVSRFNSADDFAARFALRRWGLKPVDDVAILQLGEQTARLTALRAGRIDVTLIQPPLTALARKEGFAELARLSDLGLEYLQTCVTTTRATIRAREDQVRRFVRAFVEGIHFYKTNREASMVSIGRFMKLTDPEAIEESYRAYALTLIPRAPAPTLKGVQTILDDLAEKDARARGARPEQFVDPRFVRELQETGVIERLYRAGT